MGQKTVRFSDLSGQLILDDYALARIVVQEHPELVDGPVEIEALADEAKAIEQAALRVVVVDLYLHDDYEPRRASATSTSFRVGPLPSSNVAIVSRIPSSVIMKPSGRRSVT